MAGLALAGPPLGPTPTPGVTCVHRVPGHGSVDGRGTGAGERKCVCTHVGCFTPRGCASGFLRVNIYNQAPQ